MFESLSDKLQGIFQRLRGKSRVSEADVTDALREIRIALLEADVNLKVVKEFTARIREKAIGVDVLESLSPAQQVVKIVHDELMDVLGGTETGLTFATSPPTIVMLCGLQGSGKTTLCGKLALSLKRQGRNPLMVACDIQRPAAIKQLQVLGAQIDVPVFTSPPESGAAPPKIAAAAIAHASATSRDVVLLDTAGRLHIDDALMNELGTMKASVHPHEILLIVDAMVGQDAVNFAQEFHQRLDVTGIVMTKMDGDTRGGAAISVRSITGVPIKFMGVGEKLDALEQFHPDRLASRILGMGDILSLIERAQEAVDVKEAAELDRRLRESRFDLNDFLAQMAQIKRMGPLENVIKMLPGMNGAMLDKANIDPKLMGRKEAIVRSMTAVERTNPAVINGSRRKRIALGCGQTVHEVNQFLSEFEQMRKMIRTMLPQTPGAKHSAIRPMGALKKMPKGGKSGTRFPRLPFGR